jgi:hypothetical protein
VIIWQLLKIIKKLKFSKKVGINVFTTSKSLKICISRSVFIFSNFLKSFGIFINFKDDEF